MALSLLREDSVPRLTRNQQRIFEHLQGAHRALGAYEIAATLGIKAPMTVYRALTALTRLGLVRPIPSRNVYMARSSGRGDCGAALIICDDCSTVREVELDAAIAQLRQIVLRDRFSIANITLEVVGRCIECHLRGADRLSPANHVGQH